MSEVEVTTSSAKGQVVIPKDIREELEIKKGTRFAVYGVNDTLVLRKIDLPSVKEFEKLVKFGVKFAKKKRITTREVLKDD